MKNLDLTLRNGVTVEAASAALGDMIGCDNDLCPIMWFHMHCLNIDSIPDGEWFCPNCQSVT